jgi:hypothetical protein
MNQDDNFTSSENKGMIWSLLQESNIFVGIENDKFTNIQSIFENTIKNIHVNNNSLTLLEKNKLTMETLIPKINYEKNKPKKTIQVVYKAEDFQNKRTEDFNMKLKQQQESMNLLMNPTKPKEVTFSDEVDGEDKPIGDEMDRLIAERLASRERELEIPSMTKETEAWLNTTNTNTNTGTNTGTNTSSNNSLNSLNSITNNSSLNSNIQQSDLDLKNIVKEKSFISDNIFSKLKRKTESFQLERVQTESVLNNNNININIEDEIIKIKNEQEIIKQTCLQILELVKQKDTI